MRGFQGSRDRKKLFLTTTENIGEIARIRPPRGGCARVIECNRSSSTHHRIYTFFPTLFNLVGKGSGHAQTTRDMAERQSPDGNKHPRGTPTFLTAGKAKESASS